MSVKCPSCGGPIDLTGVTPASTVECRTCHKSFRTKKNQAQRQHQGPLTDPVYIAADDTKTCPFCGETIKQLAIKCKHCGSDLTSPCGAAVTAPPLQQNPLYDQDVRESTIFDGPPSQWTNLGVFVLCGFLALLGLGLSLVETIPGWAPFGLWVFAALVAVIAYMKVRFTVYHVTTERIEVEKGWISKRIDNLDLFRMKDVRLSISIFDRIVGIGKVMVLSRDETDPVIAMRGLHDPRRLYDRLKKEAVRADRRRGVIHVES